MSATVTYKGKCSLEKYDELMSLLNLSFNFTRDDYNFQKLLPKLYSDKNYACDSNYVIEINGEIKAAVGVYDDIMVAGGSELYCRGIGNVAVHPDSRSKGYMIECMNLALSDMIKDNVDISFLGGHRQRYGYFGYEDGCPRCNVRITKDNARHYFKNIATDDIEIKDVTANDADLIEQMYALHSIRPLRSVRPKEKFYDILCTWIQQPRVLLKNGEFVGYFAGALEELTLKDMADFDSVIRTYVELYGDVDLQMPIWDTEMFDAACRIGEGIRLDESYMLSIFNYKKVIETMLSFKASRENLPDGELKVLIHGYKEDCRLMIAVSDGIPSVESFEGDCDIELSHKNAAKFFFGVHSEYRRAVSPILRAWLPLPLFVDGADHV
ncbi:MAG: GNAT family N-acetyltransferase [Clostridia bacterium]|nr:GNAT family N-acetyltransferase [Clostridia bacterium]